MFAYKNSPHFKKWVLFGVLVGVLSIQLPFLSQNPTGSAQFSQTTAPNPEAVSGAGNPAPAAPAPTATPAEVTNFPLNVASCGPKSESCTYNVIKLTGVNSWAVRAPVATDGTTVNASKTCSDFTSEVVGKNSTEAFADGSQKLTSYCKSLADKKEKPKVEGACFSDVEVDQQTENRKKTQVARFKVDSCGALCEEKTGDEKLTCHKEKLLELSVTSLEDKESHRTAINLYYNKFILADLKKALLGSSYRSSRYDFYDSDDFEDTSEEARDMIEDLLENLKPVNGLDVKRSLVKILAQDVRQQAVNSVRANKAYERNSLDYQQTYYDAISNDGYIDQYEGQQLNGLQRDLMSSYNTANRLWSRGNPMALSMRSASASSSIRDLLMSGADGNRGLMQEYDRVLNEDFRLPTRDFVSAYGNRSRRPNQYLDPVPSIFGGAFDDDYFGNSESLLSRMRSPLRGGSLTDNWFSGFNLPGLRNYRDSTISGSSRFSSDRSYVSLSSDRFLDRPTFDSYSLAGSGYSRKSVLDSNSRRDLLRSRTARGN